MLKNLIATLGILVSSPALAAVILPSTYQFTTDRPLYEVSPGGTVDVTVYLQETAIEDGGSLLLLDRGLLSIALEIRAQLQPTDPATVLSPADVTPDPDFGEGGQADILPLLLRLLETETVQTGPVGEEISPGVRRVPLGVFRFQAGDAPDETTTFQVLDPGLFGSDPDALTLDYTAIDDLIRPGSFSIVTGVPEPTSLMLLPLAATLLRRRRC